MIQSFKYFVFFSFFLLCEFGNIAHSNCETLVLQQPNTKFTQLSIFARGNSKTFIPTRLTKKQYWRSRGTNNEEDDDEKYGKLKKDKKQRQSHIAIRGGNLTIPEFLRIAAVASNNSGVRIPISSEHHNFYAICSRLHVLFQVFRI